MKNAAPKNKPGHITHGDIFDDLGFSPADTLEAKVKAEIWQALIDCIARQRFTQADLVLRLKAHQPDISNLLKGKISRVSITRLIQYAGRLNLDARITIAPLHSRNAAATANTAHPTIKKGRAEFVAAPH